MILTSSRTFSLFESMPRETPSTMKLPPSRDSFEEKKTRFLDFVLVSCLALWVWCDHVRSRRSEWPATRTRSRRVADREVDHVIEHRIVPLGVSQETNDEVYQGWELDGRYLFALEGSWAVNDVKRNWLVEVSDKNSQLVLDTWSCKIAVKLWNT